jgi:hypothetical protein
MQSPAGPNRGGDSLTKHNGQRESVPVGPADRVKPQSSLCPSTTSRLPCRYHAARPRGVLGSSCGGVPVFLLTRLGGSA